MLWRCEGLFSDHFLSQRLPSGTGYPTGTDAAALLAELTRLKFTAIKTINEEDTEKRLITPLLAYLGYGQANRRKIPNGQTLPDYLLYALPEQAEAAYETGDHYTHTIALLEAKRFGRNLSEKSRDGKKTPHQQIRDYLSSAQVPWGILTNGAKWRLYARDDRPSNYFEFDLLKAVETEDLSALRLFLALFHRDSLAPSSAGQRRIDEVKQGSIRFREEVERKLRQQVFEGVEHLAQGFLRHPANQLTPADLPAVYENSLVFLYRLLFVLNAESRGLLPTEPTNEQARKYLARYGLETVCLQLLDPIQRELYADETTDQLYARVRSLFRLINGKPPAPGQADPNAELGIPRYNGGLFDPERYPFLESNVVGDAALGIVFARLMYRIEDGQTTSFDYANLGERHLGSIYEGLLEHRLQWDPDALRPVLRNDKGERKTSGAYYTPEPLVRYLVRESLQPLLDQCEVAAGGFGIHHDPDEGIVANIEPDDRFANAVLQLNVCDPAMGSGHFLVEAVQELAEAATSHPTTRLRPELNNDGSPRRRTDGSGELLLTYEATLAYWKRRVVESCVYGVDLNPLAVELAKLSLWLKTVDRVPLNFLDHHLRSGNALLGVPVLALAKYVHPTKPCKLDWSQPTQLDFDLLQLMTKALSDAITAIHAIESTETDTHAAAKSKESLWRKLSTEVMPPFRSIADLWIAPWLGAGTGWAEYEHAIRNVSAAPAIAEAAKEVLAQYLPFHWHLEFPDIFFLPDGQPNPDGGFDAVVGNPPWERIKLQENEFFAARAPEIARLSRASDRKAAIARIRTENPALWREYELAKDAAVRVSYFLQKSAFYPEMGKGDTNLYSVFAERAVSLLGPRGRLGLLVPSGIASDQSSSNFFGGLAGTARLAGLIDFENKLPLFEDVDSRFKFCMFLVSGRDAPAAVAQCGFFLHNPAELEDPDRLFPLTPADFRLFNPNTKNSPVFRSRRDAELTRKIYQRVPVLWRRAERARYADRGKALDQTESNPWGVTFKTLFHMTNDSASFRRSDELEQGGYWPGPGRVYTKGSEQYLPLYEGKMVQAYDHRAATIIVNPANVHRPAQEVATDPAKKYDPTFSANPQFWVRSAITPPATQGWRLAFKAITAPTNVRTVIASALPNVAAGNSLFLIEPGLGLPAERLLANLNSFAMDYVARQKVGGQNLNFYIIEQLPILSPASYEATIAASTLGDLISPRVLELSYTAHDLRPMAESLGYDGPPFPWDEERRLHLRCQLDALYFAAYGLTREDATYILSTFPIVERHDQEKYGRYRTRDLILHYMAAYAAGNTDAWVAD